MLGDKEAMIAQQAISGMAKLKLCCRLPEARKEIEKIEKSYALKNIAKLVCKLGLVCIGAYYGIPSLVALFPVGIVATSIKVALVTTTVFKSIFLSLNIAFVYSIWKNSYSHLEGVKKIYQMEAIGCF